MVLRKTHGDSILMFNIPHRILETPKGLNLIIPTRQILRGHAVKLYPQCWYICHRHLSSIVVPPQWKDNEAHL